MISAETIRLTTRTQNFEKSPEKKDEGASSYKTPYTNPSSYLSPSSTPLIIEKPILDAILRPPKSTIQKSVFNPSTGAAQFYNC